MWQLWNPAAAGWIKSWFSCSLAEELFLACQDKKFFSVSAVILNTLDPFHIFLDFGKMTPRYKSGLESAKTLAEMDNKVTYCFIASCQRCSHRLGVVKICRAIYKNLCPFLLRTKKLWGLCPNDLSVSYAEVHLNYSFT